VTVDSQAFRTDESRSSAQAHSSRDPGRANSGVDARTAEP
jgi:hypothetical protein